MNTDQMQGQIGTSPQPGDRPIMQGFPPPPDARPGASNWDLPPFNRWSFLNMRMLFPTAEVRRSEGAASTLDHEDTDLSDVAFADASGRIRTIAAFLAETFTDGFLVYWRGKVRYERYFNGMQPHTLHLSQSVAKTLVGTLAGILISRGDLDVGKPLAEYVPELSGCGYRDATIRHLLDMQSGVGFSEDYNDPDSDMTRIDVASGWRPLPAGRSYEAISDVILSLPRIRPHGGAFSYRSVETDVLAWVMERATGVALAELVSREIWQKMGAERDACFCVDRAGTALADGGFNATLRDYARFGRLTLEAGTATDCGIVPIDWVRDCQAGDASKFGEPYTAVTPDGAYRNAWWIRDVNRGDLAARGVFGQMIHVDRASEMMVVKLSSWPDYLMPEFTRMTFAAIDAIRDVLIKTGS